MCVCIYIYIHTYTHVHTHISLYICIYIYIYVYVYVYIYIYVVTSIYLLPEAVRCDMVLHRVFRARRVRRNSIGGEVRHGVTSGASCETSLNKHVTPHLHRE